MKGPKTFIINGKLIVAELNATRATETSSDTEEDVLYQKDVSFSAELEIAPSNILVKTNLSEKHIDDTRLTTQPSKDREPNYTYTGERTKEVDGLKSLMEDGVSRMDINIIADTDREDLDRSHLKVTTLGPSLEQKVSSFFSEPRKRKKYLS